MSNLLLKAAQHVIRTSRAKRAETTVERCPNSSQRGSTYFLGNNIQARTRKLPFVSAALLEVTDNNRGVMVSTTVEYSEAYIDVGYAYADKAFDAKIKEMIEQVKAI